MTTVQDAKRIVKGFYGNINASRADIVLIEKYLARTPSERANTRALFQHWFEAHHHIRMIVDKGGRAFFYPRFEKFLKDDGGFTRYATNCHEQMSAMRLKIIEALKKADDETVAQRLREYNQLMEEYLKHNELLELPILLEHYTADTYKREMTDPWAKSLPLADGLTILPWITARLKSEDKDEMIRLLPFFGRVLYRHYLEPRFIKLMQF